MPRRARTARAEGSDPLGGGRPVAGEVAYRFKHILVREAAYLATAKKLRATLHERFADWLERVAGERVGEYHEILGYHFEQAYRYRTEVGRLDDDARTLAGRAARHLGAAGRRANDRGDVHAGANLLGRAVTLLPADSLERLELMLPYGYRARRVRAKPGAPGESTRSWTSGRPRWESGASRHPRASCAPGRSCLPIPTSIVLEVRATVEEAIETLTRLGDEAGLAQSQPATRHDLSVPGSTRPRQVGGSNTHSCTRTPATTWSRAGSITQSLAMTLCVGPMPVGEAPSPLRGAA